MTIDEKLGTTVNAIYFADESQVQIEDEQYDILTESDDFIALFSRGKSIYRRGHSEYEPARILFCEIQSFESIPRSGPDSKRESMVRLTVHLVSPVRRS